MEVGCGIIWWCTRVSGDFVKENVVSPKSQLFITVAACCCVATIACFPCCRRGCSSLPCFLCRSPVMMMMMMMHIIVIAIVVVVVGYHCYYYFNNKILNNNNHNCYNK